MRLADIFLKGYFGIYNGLGLERLYIDFKKCKSDIIVIKGDNGSGKTTLNKAINPHRDPNKEFLPHMDAQKIISYFMDNGDIVKINHTSTLEKDGKRKNSSHVYMINHKTLVQNDLNPSGNVNEAENIINELFELDAGFITLSRISSENKGLVDKTPSERKKFINSMLDSLEAFNDIYKKISKRGTVLKSMLNSITTKIDNLGNMEQIQNNIKTLSNTLGSLEDRKVSLVSNISRNKERIESLSKSGDIINTVNSLEKELEYLRVVIKNGSKFLESNITESSLNNLRSQEKVVYSQTESLNSELGKIQKRMVELNQSLEEKKLKLESLGDQKLIDSINARISYLEESTKTAVDIFKQIGFDNYNSVTEDEYDCAIRQIDSFNAILHLLRNQYSHNLIQDALKIYRAGKFNREYNQETLDSLIATKQKSEILYNGQEMLRKSCEDFDAIPSDCNHIKDCPFITSIVKAKLQLLPDQEHSKLAESIRDLDKDIRDYKEKLEYEKMIDEVLDSIHKMINIIIASKNIIYKIYPIEIDSAINIIGSGTKVLELNTKLYMEHKNFIGLIQSNKEDLRVLREQLVSTLSNKELSDVLIKDISLLERGYSALYEERNDIMIKIQKSTELLQNIQASISEAEYILKEKEQLTEKQKRLTEIESILHKMKDDYILIQNIQEEINLDMVEINSIGERLASVTDSINENKYRTVLYNDYVKEYQEYTKQNEILEVIKYHCSPTTGLQTVFISVFMNDIISVSNKLLSMFFGGEFVLHPFVVNETEFRIPCLGKGLINDDISSMSTSQRSMISMIISFALLHNVSKKFNIINLDEIDGGLDNINRLSFIHVLRKLMGLLNYSQCVMISHNAELGIYDADLIILKNSDPNAKFDGNIIYNYGG